MVRFQRFLEIIEEDELVENARVVGDHLLGGLKRLEAQMSPLVSNARGRGLMIAFDLPTPALRDKAHETITKNGLLLLTCGVRSIRFRPSLDLTKADADAGLDLLHKSLKEL